MVPAPERSTPDQPDDARARVRVVGYNTRDFLDDRDAAARVVRALAPDVLCLQEVPRRLFGPTRVARFAASCGLVPVGRHRGSGGTTILVRPGLTVVQAGHHRLPVRLLERTRGYAVVTVVLPGARPLVVASVHLSLRPEERVRHLQTVLGSMPPLGQAELVVAGDLNENDSGAAWQALAGVLPVVSPLVPTFPARHPVHLLDGIFASPGLTVLPHDPVALAESDLARASDHRPIWVDLALPGA